MWQNHRVSSQAPSFKWKDLIVAWLFVPTVRWRRGLAGVTAQPVVQHRWTTAVGNKHKWTRQRRRPLGERWKTVCSYWSARWEAATWTLLAHSSEIYPCDDTHWDNKSDWSVVIWFLLRSHRLACCSLNSFGVQTPIKDPERRSPIWSLSKIWSQKGSRYSSRAHTGLSN